MYNNKNYGDTPTFWIRDFSYVWNRLRNSWFIPMTGSTVNSNFCFPEAGESVINKN